MQATADWLDRNASNHERFFLFVAEFDPRASFLDQRVSNHSRTFQ